MRRGEAARLAAVCLAAAALWAVYLELTFVGFMHDPVWYLEPARSFARGWGLVTRIMLPAQVAGFPQGFHPPVPFLHHGPVAPALIGAAYRLFGIQDWVPLALDFACTMLTGLVLYVFGRHIIGEKQALTATAMLLLHPMVMDANITASTDAPFVLLLTLAFACLWLSREGRARRWLALSAALLGAASSTRLAGQTYWPGFLLAVFWLHRDWRLVGLFAAALAVSLAPLFCYNHAAAGILLYSPGFYALNWSPSFPGFRSSTTFMDLTSFGAVLTYPRDFLQKAITGPLYAADRFLAQSGSPWVMACAALGLVSAFTGPLERLRRLTLCVGLPVMAANAVLSYGGVHYLGPLFPLFFLLGSSFLWSFGARNRWRSWPAVPLLALAMLGPTALWVKSEWKDKPRRLEQRQFQDKAGDFIRRHVGQDEVVYTDSNRMVVWYGDRIAIALTATRQDAEKTFQRLPPDALLLTSLRIDSPDYDDLWREAFYQKKPVLGFEACRDMVHGSYRATLFRRAGACG